MRIVDVRRITPESLIQRGCTWDAAGKSAKKHLLFAELIMNYLVNKEDIIIKASSNKQVEIIKDILKRKFFLENRKNLGKLVFEVE